MRRLIRICAFAVAALPPTGIVFAQELSFERSSTEWEIKSGVFLTPAGQKVALQAVAASFSQDAIEGGVEPLLAAKFSEAILAKGVIVANGDGLFAKWEHGSVQLDRKVTAAPIRALNANYFAAQLERLPRIMLFVEPVPPKDFVVEINGETLPIPEKLEYAVDPGWVSVRVMRKSKPDCSWSGELVAGDRKDMQCKL